MISNTLLLQSVTRAFVLALALLLPLAIIGCGSENTEGPSSTGVDQPAETQSRSPSVSTLPSDQIADDEEQIRSLLEEHHATFLAGDSEGHCATFVEEMAAALQGCTHVPPMLELQQSDGLVVEDIEILDLNVEGDKAYAAVFEQMDSESPNETPTDYELTKSGDVWRISLSRYRTERTEGEAKCFVGGTTNDLC